MSSAILAHEGLSTLPLSLFGIDPLPIPLVQIYTSFSFMVYVPEPVLVNKLTFKILEEKNTTITCIILFVDSNLEEVMAL